MRSLDELEVDRSSISAHALTDKASDRQYWLSKTSEERFEALEILRQIVWVRCTRNAVNGPPLQEFDISLRKEIQGSEPVRLHFRAEAYNLLNHTNFNLPNRTAFTVNFGRISSAHDSRQLQFALRLAF